MINAFLYLQLTAFRNALVQRVRRLRQPKYFLGAMAGLGYFYFLFFRHVLRTPSRPSAFEPEELNVPTDLVPVLVSCAALVLFVIAAIAWAVPSSRAALQFSEAEIAFLFPAPVTRRRLIHFKLLRSQLAILVSTFFLSLVFRRAGTVGGNTLTHAVGWWIVLSTINLHFLAASFARQRLLEFGLCSNRRRAVLLALLTLGLIVLWHHLRHRIAAPAPEDVLSLSSLAHYFGGLLQSPPLGWILSPFALVVRPYFAPAGVEFIWALIPAGLVMAVHYWWVMRADISFEEASLERARKFAEVATTTPSAGWHTDGIRPRRRREAPFRLPPSGPIAVAFLWKNLIALGPLFRLRTGFALVVLILAFHLWARFSGLDPAYYTTTAILSLGFGAWLLLAAPMMMRNDVRLLVSHFDWLKSYPLRGWQIVLGSLLPGMTVIAAAEWLLLLLGTPCIGSAAGAPPLAARALATGALGVGLILPPLAGLLLSIPFAATLFFPAWTENQGPRGGGVEVLGQRLIFFAGYLLVLLAALLPASLCGAFCAFIVHWLADTTTAIVTTALLVAGIIAAEFIAAVWWLGERFERLDLSQEMPR